MASRRDQFQSYQFMVQRVISSLVLHETDPAQTPLRRMAGAAFGSVMIAVLALAVAGVIGVIFPGGNNTWQTDGKVIVEAETGSRFVWLQDKSGTFYLHPVANFASAALLVGTTETTEVSRSSLSGVPRGPRLGIPDAPDAVPKADQMLGAPWTLCSLPAQTISGERIPNTALVVGRGRNEGEAIGESGVLVRDIERGTLHLVWNGHQYLIPAEDPVLEGLGWRQVPQIEVGTAWLSALPAGKDLAAPVLSGLGQPSAALTGGVVGEVRLVEAAGGGQYYLVGADKISAITEVQAFILLADPTIKTSVYGGKTPVAGPLSAADANAAPRGPLPASDPTAPPAVSPPMASVNSPQSTVCASFRNAGLVPEVAVQAAVEGAELAPATQRRTQDGTVLADRVQVEPTWGTVVESMVSPTARSGSLYLVTDEGKRYALANETAVASLGLQTVTPVRMPASLVARIPAGDTLDPKAAQLPV